MNRAELAAAKRAARHSRIAHLLRTTCSYCHAPAGEPCRSKSGTPIWEIAQIHEARLTPRGVGPPLPPNRPARLAVTDQAAQQRRGAADRGEHSAVAGVHPQVGDRVI
jgi:hypothetical protein